MKGSSEKIFRLLFVVIALCGLYCYNPFVLYFQNDDFIHIPLSAKGEFFQRNSFRPVCDLSVMIDYHLWGKNAWGYHLTNLVLHLLCCFLVYRFSVKFIRKYFEGIEAKVTALNVSLLFFVYAMHSEAVLWILGRSGILGLIFSMFFLQQYIDREHGVGSKLKYTLWLTVALLTYESAFALPGICVVFFVVDKKKSDWVNLFWVFGAFAIYLCARFIVTGEILGSYEVEKVNQQGALSTALNYAKLLYRSFIPAYSQGWLMVGLFGVITLLLSILLLKRWRNGRFVFVSVLFIVSLLPYVLLGIDAHGYEGERYLYFPLMFLCLFVVVLLYGSIHKSKADACLLLILVVHVGSLFVSASNFKVAGDVARQTITELKSITAKDTLIVNQLSQAQNGALIFRNGFEEAVGWLIDKKFKQVTVTSRRSEWEPLKGSYKVDNSDSMHFTKTIRLYFTDSALQVR